MKHRISHSSQYNAGFALPTILIASVVMIIILLAAVQATVSIRTGLFNQYYNKLSQEAAESGTTYASYCYAKVGQTATPAQWPNAGVLTPKTDCYGTPIAASSDYVMGITETAIGNVRTTFIVGPAVAEASAGSYKLSSKGSVEVLRTSSLASGTEPVVAERYNTTVHQNQSLPVYDLQSGGNTTCAIQAGKLYCWGANNVGQVGDGTLSSRLTPYPLGGLLTNRLVQSVSSSTTHTCAAADDNVTNKNNALFCWGNNTNGKYGDGTSSASLVPRQTVSPSTLSTRYVSDVSVSSAHTCIIAPDLPDLPSSFPVPEYCWGTNNAGQAGEVSGVVQNPKLSALGDGIRSVVSPFPYLTNVQKIANGSQEFSCAINSATVWCWGSTAQGQGGYGSTTAGANSRARATSLTSATALTTNNDVACAINSGQLYCWGHNAGYRYAASSTASIATPNMVAGTASAAIPHRSGNLVSVARSAWSGCVLVNPAAPASAQPGSVWCWGYNTNGELGQGTFSGPTTYGGATAMGATLSSTTVLSPVNMVRVGGQLANKKVVNITAGTNHFCAMTDERQTYCWGLNTAGQLGDGTTTRRATPTQVQLPPMLTY